jgi:hypothetical protein
MDWEILNCRPQNMAINMTVGVSRDADKSLAFPISPTFILCRESNPALPDSLRSGESGTGSTQLLSTLEELLERKSSDCLENSDYGRRGSAALTTRHLSSHKS